MFIKLQITNVNELFHLSSILHQFHFRGQSDIGWPLQSNYERELKSFRYFTQIENMIINDFKVKSLNYLSDIPSEDDSFGWLTYIQQHGGFTPLLDFTRSIYIATFFALNECAEKNKPVIWAIDGYKLNGLVERNIRKNHDLKGYDLPQLNRQINYQCLLNDIIKNKVQLNIPAICKIHPKRQFTRLGVQQGVFFTILNTQQKFHNQLASLLNITNNEELLNSNNTILYSNEIDDELKSKFAIRISFPENIDKKKLLWELWKMNINYESMFPGLDGLAKSVKQTIYLNEELNQPDT